VGELTVCVFRDICKDLKGTERTSGKYVTFYGRNDVSSYYRATGNLVLISHVLESCGCDTVLLEIVSDVSYGATASVFGIEMARVWYGHNFA